MIDRDNRILLVHFDFSDHHPTGIWACPGGGLEPGESLTEGVIRELAEEAGLPIADPGPPIWVKEQHRQSANWDGQHDTYFLIEVDSFEPKPRFSEAELRAEHVDGIRWWGYDELLVAQRAYDAGETSDPAYTVFSPRSIGHLVTALITGGRPRDPIDVSTPPHG